MEHRPRITSSENLGWLFGALLIVLGAAGLLSQFVHGFSSIVWAVIFGGGGLAFLFLAQRTPANRWALIPGYVLIVIGVLIVLGTLNIMGDLIGIFVMLAIGFPFLYVYLKNRSQWWALIPAYTMAAIAGIIAISAVAPDSPIMPTYIMLAIALPFYYVYFRNPSNWWALIPAGIMTLIGLGIFLTNFQFVFPIALILLGAFLLFRQFAGRTPASQPEPPKTGPKADKPPSV